MISLDVISIASNGYTKYWIPMIESLLENLHDIDKVYVHILTDDPEMVNSASPKSQKAEYLIHPIPSEPWPLPTLNRYKYIKDILPNLRTSYFLYIDADMLIHKGFEQDFLTMLRSNEINFVLHPGYWYPRLGSFLGIPPRKLVSILKMLVAIGGFGAWETRKSSAAFVTRKNRKRYICGGIWFGKNKTLHDIVNTLHAQTQLDLDAGIIAKWHDESHLNSWYCRHGGSIVDPSYCFDPTYKNLRGLKPKIEAVNKSLG